MKTMWRYVGRDVISGYYVFRPGDGADELWFISKDDFWGKR